MNKIKKFIEKTINRFRLLLACILMGIYYFVKVEEGMEFFKAPFSKDENKYFAKEKSKAIARALKRKIPNVVFKRSTLKDIDNIVEDLDKPYDYKFNDI